ncbi:protein kinase [Acidobacteriota bacterium]
MDKIGKYSIIGELGRGAMGIVYKGEDPMIGRSVAIKTIRFDTFSQEKDREHAQQRFMREARSAGNLSHPNIVTIYDVGEDQGLTFIVMEFIEGQSLESLIASNRHYSVDEVYGMMAPIADALDYAHARGVIHRDIKPGNILIDNNGKPQIVDFGIARLTSSTMTQTSVVMGTPFYMSPEQLAGKKVDSRADVFSLGAVIYEALTLQKPFPGDTITTVIYNIVNELPAPARTYQSDLPDGLDHIIRKALAKNLNLRYGTCTEMVRDLANYQAYAGIPLDAERTVKMDAPSPPRVEVKTPPEYPTPPTPDDSGEIGLGGYETESKTRNRKPLLLVVAAMMVVVAGVIAAVMLLGPKEKIPVLGPSGPPSQQVEQSVEKPPSDPANDPAVQESAVEEAARIDQILVSAWSIEIDTGDSSQALDEVEKALAIDPSHYGARKLKTELLVNAGRLDDALSLVLGLRTERPDDLSLLSDLANVYEAREELDKAVESLQLFVQKAPESEDIGPVTNRIQSLQDQIAELSATEELITSPQNKKPIPKVDPGTEKEKPVVKKPVDPPQEDPETSRINTLLNDGVELYKADQFDDCIKRMQDVLKLDPGNTTASYYINRSRSAKRDRDNQQEVRTLLSQANSHLKNENYDRSIETARQALQLDPKNSEAQRIINTAESQNKEWEKEISVMFNEYKRIYGTHNLIPFFQRNCIASVFQNERTKAQMLINLYKDFDNQFSAASFKRDIDEKNGTDTVSVEFRQVSKAKSKNQDQEGELVNGSYKWELRKIIGSWKIINITYWGR